MSGRTLWQLPSLLLIGCVRLYQRLHQPIDRTDVPISPHVQ